MEIQKKKDTDMTEGVIWKQLLWFALPLMVGNVFQQFYNTVDSIVVGNFVGKEALAAVGSVGSIINSVIGFFGGLATGASVVIAQSYGAKNDGKVSIAVHTTFCMTLVLCVVFTIVGISATPFLLRFMSMPDDVIGEATEYLMIYFSGVSGLMIYNMGSGVLRAVGDSKRPLYFLVFSACVNTVLDLVFVVKFHWGIAGVAWATVIAQGLSAVLILVVLFRENGAYRLVLSKMKTDRGALQEIVRIGFHQLLRERPRPRPVRKPRNGPPARNEVNVEQFILAGEGTLPQHHTERIIQGPDHRFAAACVEVGPRLAVKRIIR
mgnify:CR=1 FL=1